MYRRTPFKYQNEVSSDCAIYGRTGLRQIRSIVAVQGLTMEAFVRVSGFCELPRLLSFQQAASCYESVLILSARQPTVIENSCFTKRKRSFLLQVLIIIKWQGRLK